MWWFLFKDWCCHFPIIWTIFSRLIYLSFPWVLLQMLSALWLGISVSSDHDLKPAVKCQKKVERGGGWRTAEDPLYVVCAEQNLLEMCESRSSGAIMHNSLPSQKPGHDSESPHSICRPYSSTFYPLQLCKAFTGKQETTHGSSGFRFPYKFKN